MRTIVFEDDGWRRFLPLTALRSLLEVRCGILPLWEKTWLATGEKVDFVAFRPEIRALAEKKYEKKQVPFPACNPAGSDLSLWLNGRLLWTPELIAETRELAAGEALVLPGGTLAAAAAAVEASGSDLSGRLSAAVTQLREVSWPALEVWYDLLEFGPAEIGADSERLGLTPTADPAGLPEGAHLLGEAGAYLADGVVIDPGVVFDTRHGPVVVDSGAHLMTGAVLAGPCYIGRESLVKVRAVLSEGCSIGERCKVGGELECVFMQGWANKQHDGYLGHAVVGSWVNLGAATNNSDLKNTYGEVDTWLDGQMQGSGRMFLGCCLGDHTKTAIGTTLITGMVAGVGCNLFGAGFHPVRVPDFIWGQPGAYKEYLFDRVVETARTVMARRQVDLPAEYEALMRACFEASAPEREVFLNRLQHSRTAARRRDEH